jgi:hypothetical protein
MLSIEKSESIETELAKYPIVEPIDEIIFSVLCWAGDDRVVGGSLSKKFNTLRV